MAVCVRALPYLMPGQLRSDPTWPRRRRRNFAGSGQWRRAGQRRRPITKRCRRSIIKFGFNGGSSDCGDSLTFVGGLMKGALVIDKEYWLRWYVCVWCCVYPLCQIDHRYGKCKLTGPMASCMAAARTRYL